MNVKCPHCKKEVPWGPESQYRPFCSERCRIIDLGAWADGTYAIPSNDVSDESSVESDTENLENSENSEADNDSET